MSSYSRNVEFIKVKCVVDMAYYNDPDFTSTYIQSIKNKQLFLSDNDFILFLMNLPKNILDEIIITLGSVEWNHYRPKHRG